MLMLIAKFFCCPGGITTDGLAYIVIFGEAFAKRARTDDLLLYRGKLFQFKTRFAP